MGLFNSGKNEKVEKVSKYERHYNVPPGQQQPPPSSSSRRRSSKHRSQGNEPHIRAMSQPPMMRLPGNPFYPGVNNYLQPPPSMNNQIRYPMMPFDLSKYPTGNAFASPMNIQPTWNQAMPFMQQQFPFQQQPNWQMASPANYPFLQNIQF